MTTEPLFRPEALEYQALSSSRYGAPMPDVPFGWWFVAGLIGAFMACLIVFISTVDFARSEMVRGKLRVDGAEARLYASEPGLITQLAVKNGDQVQAGDLITLITTERFMADGEALSAATLASLQDEKAALQARRVALEKASALSEQQARHRYDTATQQETDLRAELDVARERLEIAETRAADARQFLAEGLIAEPQLNQRLDAAAALKQNLLQIESQVSEAQSLQRRAELEIDQIQATLERDQSDIDTRLIEINLKTDQARSRTAYRLHAPIAGHVTGLQGRTGERVAQDQPLAVILPENSTLIAELYVPSRAMGFIEPGQQARLQYDAYPYQKFGVAFGTIAGVSGLGQSEGELGLPVQHPDLFYRTEIVLDKQTHEAFGRDMPLQAGMELTAVLVLEDRKIIEWLLEPLRTG